MTLAGDFLDFIVKYRVNGLYLHVLGAQRGGYGLHKSLVEEVNHEL